MKICVTSQGDTLDSQVDPRFGRCAYFILVDTETMKFEAINNAQAQAAGGAGVQSGQLMAEKEVQVVLTGNAGPNAYRTLNASGIEVITGVSGTIQETIEKYKKGNLTASEGPNVKSHFVMKGGN